MKTIEQTIYKFSELSEEGKTSAIAKLSGINTDYDWWDACYKDAKNVDIRITGFDLYDFSISAHFIFDAIDTANSIIENRGKMCKTHKLAKYFINRYEVLSALLDVFEELSFDTDIDGFSELAEKYTDEIEELEDRFLSHLKNEYINILVHEYEYLSTKEAIVETIECNEYDFTEDGELY
tara:strand:- start:1016 stop:1555 length:540 start_codon:yes stop_codon:yes gene_type:complete